MVEVLVNGRPGDNGTSATPTPTTDYEHNLLRHIEKFGCSITSVFDPEGKDPDFSYSIGITRSCGAPELIVVGFGADFAKTLINVYNERCQQGGQFDPDRAYSGFLEGFEVRFLPVARRHRATYMRSACWLYSGANFPAMQLVWPSTLGCWPWDQLAPETLRTVQPLLQES